MLSYRFYLRNNVIQVAINHGRNKKQRVSLRLKLPPTVKWNSDKERAEGQSAAASRINKKITYIESIILDSEDAHKAKDRIQDYIAPVKKESFMLFDIIENFFKGVRSGSIKSSKGKVMAKGTIANYKSMMDMYKDFGEDIDVTDVDLYSLDRKERSKAIIKARNHFNAFMDYMVIMDYAPSYQNEMRAKMKSVLNWVKREMGIEVPNDIRKVYVVNDHIEIPLKYYPMLLNHTIAPSDDLEMVLDTMMKIQLSTALRFIDVYELKSENISWGETPMVSTRNKKTNVKTIAPLAKSASVLIKRNLDETGDVFRGYRKYINPLEGKTYKKQTFIFYLNNWIKHIATNFISESCEISKQNAAGEVYRDYVEISKEITSHDLRRLAANYYLNSGASEMAVKNMLGHAKDSRAFKKHYVQAYSRENVEEIIKIQSDL